MKKLNLTRLAITFGVLSLLLNACTKDSEVIDKETSLKAAILSVHDGATYSPGDKVKIQFDFATNLTDWSANKIHIDLYYGDNYLTRIASNVNFWNYEYIWTVPYNYFFNSLKFKITNVDNVAQYTYSYGYF